MAGPTDLEQLLLEYVNDARLNPQGDAARYLTGYAPLGASDADIASALRYFNVSGTALQGAFQTLTPVQPVAWNDNLAQGARAHSQAMIDAGSQTHQAPGEADLGARATGAGYSGWSRLGENIFAFATSPVQAHAGFMVDWGNGPDGMQSPAGHRDNIMNGAFREVGIGILTEGSSANPVGPLVVTQDFGTRGAGSFVLGVAYTDNDRNGFYSVGEGRSDLAVTVGGSSIVSTASGGWQLASGTGARTVSLSGGGLAGPVTVQVAATSDNVKIDVVGGTELKVSASATISGPVGIVDATSAAGERLTFLGDAAIRLIGAPGADTLTGGQGADVILGGAGADVINGDAGNDHLYGQSPNGGSDEADQIAGGAGGDYIQGNAGADTLDGGSGSDRIYGGADADLVTGGDGNDTINGNLGDDTLDGGADNDVIRGGRGNDRLVGGAGDDQLSGDLGDDVIVGGAGVDRLTGGDGADLFRFGAGDAPFVNGTSDLITDYTPGTDHLALGFAVGTVLTGTAQANGVAAMAYAQGLFDGHGGSGEVAAIAVGGETWLFFGGSGGATIDSTVRLAGNVSVTTADFV